jgi:superfamily II DNA helicase RecQ
MEKQWERIAGSEVFRENIAFVSVNEAHLIDEWGEDFRPAFHYIGPFVRGRLPQHISVGAQSAGM